jgi:lipopolysaccharide export LptBFGC system permease protein LptF
MSEHGFHVHGPHDHAVEHAAQHGSKDSFAGMIAVMTAVLATIGAIFAYMGGATQANAGLYKNNAGIKQSEASDQWNFYQAKSMKQALAEQARDLSSDDSRKTAYQAKVDRYEKEKNDIMAAAKKLEDTSREWDARSEAEMHLHHRWAQATTALQISIALAAIALLTRRRWLEWGMFGVAGLGVLLGAAAVLHY